MVGVEQPFVHVDVDHLRAILDLLASDLDGGFIVVVEDQLLEARRAGDIGAFTDIDEVGGGRLGHDDMILSVGPGRMPGHIILYMVRAARSATRKKRSVIQAAMVKGSSPESRVLTVTAGILRGSRSATAWAMAAI